MYGTINLTPLRGEGYLRRTLLWKKEKKEAWPVS